MGRLVTPKGLADLGLTGSLLASETEPGDAIDVSKTDYFWFFVKNLGASTDLTVILYGLPSATGIETPLATFNLNATTVVKGSKFVEKNPSFIKVKATNNDVGNATTYNITVETHRG